MPEASIDEDGHLRSAENNVGDTLGLRQERQMKAMTQPFGMQSSAEIDLRTRALMSHAGHSSAYFRRRGLSDCHLFGPSPCFQAAPGTFSPSAC